MLHQKQSRNFGELSGVFTQLYEKRRYGTLSGIPVDALDLLFILDSKRVIFGEVGDIYRLSGLCRCFQIFEALCSAKWWCFKSCDISRLRFFNRKKLRATSTLLLACNDTANPMIHVMTYVASLLLDPRSACAGQPPEEVQTDLT